MTGTRNDTPTAGRAGDGAKTGKNEGMLEKIAQAVNPPSREISNEELKDPGANIPRTPMDEIKNGGAQGSTG